MGDIQPQQSTINETLDRIIARLDHRWKRDGILPEGANTRAFLSAQAVSLAELWEILSDLRSLNDLEALQGYPLDLEAADLRLVRRHGWTDADLLWWIKLHLMLYVSNGTVPEIKRLVSYYLRRNLTDAHHIKIYQGKCGICQYEEPAFYTLEFPFAWLQEDDHWLRFDPDDEKDQYNKTTIGGWDNAMWGDEPEEKTLKFLRFLSRATAAGVRINALGYGGLQFDPDDESEEPGESTMHGWDVSVWNGAAVEVVEDYGITQIELDRYHACVPRETDWQSITPPMEGYEPQGLLFDSEDDDEIHRSIINGWDVAVWLDKD